MGEVIQLRHDPGTKRWLCRYRTWYGKDVHAVSFSDESGEFLLRGRGVVAFEVPREDWGLSITQLMKKHGSALDRAKPLENPKPKVE